MLHRPSQAKKSYLDIARIIETARAFGADAIHPGHGFLSENAAFADACANYGITFIGPSGDAIRRMGDKAMARSTMIQAGVPVVPGTEGLITDEEEARRTALAIGCPVLIKATAGGGGRACASWKTRRISRARSARPRRKRNAPSAIPASIWKNTCPAPATWKCRSWPTAAATPCGWANGTAPPSDAIRRSSRNRPLPS